MTFHLILLEIESKANIQDHEFERKACCKAVAHVGVRLTPQPAAAHPAASCGRLGTYFLEVDWWEVL